MEHKSCDNCDKCDKYFFVSGEADHYDLQDLFGGVYLETKKMWRFPKHQESEINKFLADCLSDTDSIEDSDEEKKHKRDRLHRSNSFNASDSSNEDVESIDGSYRRSRNK